MPDSLLCHDMMHNSTYMSQVEVDIILHSVLVVDSYGIPLVLYLFQSLLSLVLHLCNQLDLLMVRCTGEPGYTAWDYIVVVWYCTMDSQCYIVVVQCYMGLVLG
jgi:hypothetical protein